MDGGIELQRVEKVLTLLPDDARTVLDVGCGPGLLLNRITGKETMGLDISPSALEKVKGPTTLGTSSNLPFPDGGYDLVVACELLEHLPGGAFESTVAEIARVADRYIVVSVPNRQDLRQDQAKCPECGAVFNKYYHLRSFDPDMLEELFDGFEAMDVVEYGGPDRVQTPLGIFMRHRIFRRWRPFENAVCPECGYASFRERGTGGSEGGRAVGLIKRVFLGAPLLNEERKRWLIARYKRRRRPRVNKGRDN